MRRSLMPLIWCLAAIGGQSRLRAEDPVAAAPVNHSGYVTRDVQGWTVFVADVLADGGGSAELGREVLELLDHRLVEVRRVVPTAPLAELQKTPIWVELDNSRQGPGACYHPSAEWLREHGFNPEKARSVEICSARNFLDWSRDQPAMLIHELAHAYHHQVLGHDEQRITAAYEAACESGRLEDVLDIQGRHRRHYALENEKEYFAEMTEAWFGTNDFYPFVRSELQECDPAMYELLREIWGEAAE